MIKSGETLIRTANLITRWCLSPRNDARYKGDRIVIDWIAVRPTAYISRALEIQNRGQTDYWRHMSNRWTPERRQRQAIRDLALAPVGTLDRPDKRHG